MPKPKREPRPTPHYYAIARRLTHTYVGRWRHLDRWEDVGTIKILNSIKTYSPYERERHYYTNQKLDQCYSYRRRGPHKVWGGRYPSKTEIRRHMDNWSNDGEGDLRVMRVVAYGFKGMTRDEICSAIADEYTVRGCDHVYDCCGCASYHASVRHAKRNEFILSVRTSYNV